VLADDSPNEYYGETRLATSLIAGSREWKFKKFTVRNLTENSKFRISCIWIILFYCVPSGSRNTHGWDLTSQKQYLSHSSCNVRTLLIFQKSFWKIINTGFPNEPLAVMSKNYILRWGRCYFFKLKFDFAKRSVIVQCFSSSDITILMCIRQYKGDISSRTSDEFVRKCVRLRQEGK
jgi:hypothetical protein